MGNGAPPPITSPSPAAELPPQEADDELDPDNDVDDTYEPTPDICGTYLTALRGVQTLLQLQLELHVPWDDDVAGEGRRLHGLRSKQKGRAWAKLRCAGTATAQRGTTTCTSHTSTSTS